MVKLDGEQSQAYNPALIEDMFKTTGLQWLIINLLRSVFVRLPAAPRLIARA
jgi:hypothetical protein